ncbi:MAG: PDZ domain-containing protein [Planctomycetaceae bacterium]|nr:PDZ domain-containing protein [Planctomycetales bacterium]MCB9921673.1 PDZ domain-containing protein [Planctomycetaceae bacterium]
MRFITTATFLLLIAGASSVVSQESTPMPDEVAAWVNDLSAESYTRRDAATNSLIRGGVAVINPLMEGMAEHGLEVTTRGIYVLQQLAVAGDAATEAAARASLEKIAAARVTAAARHARDALDKLDTLRQQRALDELQRLGAHIDRNHQELSSAMGPLFTVEINNSWRGTVDDLRWLAFLHDVQQVSFVGDKVTDAWMAHVSGMPNVQLVKIKRGSISDAGLASLTSLERLEFVRLLYVDIGDDAVVHLAHCQRVTRMDLFGTKMTREGETKLREALAARIDRRRGAFLGIQPTQPDNPVWEIGHVTEGSAADKAGLRAGDAFVTYDTKKVGDFQSLTAMIAEHDAGHIVEVTLRREGEIITRRIQLGEWD